MDYINEEFRQIYINNELTKYVISNYGTVKNTITNAFIKPAINRGGYMYVNLSHNGVTYNTRIHRLVALYFIPNIDNKPIINHKDGNKLNNRVDNLEWCTSSENNKHARDTGLNKGVSGSKSGRAILNDDIVIEICKLLEDGSMSTSDISKKLNVTKSQVEGILYRGHWKHISSNFDIDFHKVKKSYGNNRKFSKLNTDIVLDILKMRDDGLKYKEIQNKLEFYVSKETLRRICNRELHSDIYDKYQKMKLIKDNISSTTIENEEDMYYIHIDL